MSKAHPSNNWSVDDAGVAARAAHESNSMAYPDHLFNQLQAALKENAELRRTIQDTQEGMSAWTACHLALPTEEDLDFSRQVIAWDSIHQQPVKAFPEDLTLKKGFTHWMRTGLTGIIGPHGQPG